MNLLDRMLRPLGYERRTMDASWAAIGANVGFPTAMAARAAENLSAVLACTSAIASALSSIPALIYRRQDGARIEAESHPVTRLTRAGWNDGMTWPEGMEHLVASTLLTGNGLAEIRRAPNGALTGLRFIPWQWVTVSELRSGRLAYDVSDGKGRSWRLLQGEVIHLRDRTDDGMIGRSRLSRAARTVEAAHHAAEFASQFLQNGAQPSGVIKSPAPLTLDQMSMLRDQFNSRYSGAKNAGKTLVLDAGLEWMAAQISPEDAELLETRKFGVEEICRLFQVPPPLVQDYSHNTFTNSETAGRWFAMFCLAPWARKIEAEFARSVFPTGGPFEMEMDLSGFLRGDPATRWNAHAIALANKVLDPDEVRQLEGWNPRAATASETPNV
ncbi:phage portal protein [Sphingomonas ursincola]|uniref:phage portal protein n=1 Tax=Sphingomonas ursincola TaxID=56361 RepID=UPI0023549354|nr:phage portal protein [Sphingomonas ursincola]MBY0620814.1 phage portal protein [Sphingomonas ursincola]